jgi:hypothetical protein
VDHTFKVKSFNVNNYSNAQCLCLFKKSCKNLFQFEESLNKLLNYWRLKSYSFVDRGLFARNPVKVQYLRNCPPGVASYDVSEQLRYCKFYACPWCWNRKFCAGVFKKIKQAKKEIDTLDFLIYEKISFFNKSDYKKSINLVFDQVDLSIGLCKKFIRRNCVKGGITNTYLEPAPSGFKVVSKILICVTKFVDPPDGFELSLKSKSATKLAYNFGSYPFCFLKESATKGFCYFITHMPKKRKKFTSFGLFYRSKQ